MLVESEGEVLMRVSGWTGVGRGHGPVGREDQREDGNEAAGEGDDEVAGAAADVPAAAVVLALEIQRGVLEQWAE